MGCSPSRSFHTKTAGGVQAKTTETKTGIGVEENGPVVKLLPEDDVRVGYGFVTVFHDSTLCLPLKISPGRATPVEGIKRHPQSVCQGKAGLCTKIRTAYATDCFTRVYLASVGRLLQSKITSRCRVLSRWSSAVEPGYGRLGRTGTA
jgi:hypothetical protein